MSRFFYAWCVLAFFITGCADQRLKQLDQHVKDGNVREAKSIFKELLDEKEDPNLERRFIIFLFDNNQYVDFKKKATSYLNAHPEDKEVRDLWFEYYARLARDAERTSNYEDALQYIVNYLLSPDYKDYRKWESRQTTIMRKWFQDAEDANDVETQKKIISQMKLLGFDNLARSLAPDLYDGL